MPANPQNVLEYVKASGQALAEAQQLAESVAAERTKIASVVPDYVQALMQAKLADNRPLVAEHEKSAAIEMLSTHEGALRCVGNMLGLLNSAKEASDKAAEAARLKPMGRGVEFDKKASSEPSNYVGRVRGENEKSAAARAFEQKLGLGHL